MGSLNRHVRRQMAKFAGKVDKKALKRIIAQEGGQGGASAAGATAPVGSRKGPLERRMPEKGELFVLAGVDFSTPVLFSLEGYTDDGRAIIRFAKKEDFEPKIASEEPAVKSEEITAERNQPMTPSVFRKAAEAANSPSKGNVLYAHPELARKMSEEPIA